MLKLIDHKNDKERAMLIYASRVLMEIKGKHSVNWLSDETGVSRTILYNIINKKKNFGITTQTRFKILERFNKDIFFSQEL